MSISEFVYNGRGTRVVFGSGALVHVWREVRELNARRALILSGLDQAKLVESVAAELGAGAAGVFDRATMHVPASIVAEARAVAVSLEADCLIAIAGQSSIGWAKASS